MDTGVRDLEATFFLKANSTQFNDIYVAKIYQIGLYMLC